MVVPRRHELTDAEWALLEPLLPPQRGHGRPAHDHRRILNGILFVRHTGVPWRDLPERYGPWQTVYSRFRRWTARGLWAQLLEQLQASSSCKRGWPRRTGSPGRSGASTARSSARTSTPQEPAGRGEKNPPRSGGSSEPADHALGRSRGGFGTKVHLVTDGRGLPLALRLTAGQRQEYEMLAPVLDAVRIRLPRGRPRQRPDALAGDKAYSFPRLRRWLRAHQVRPVIPERRDQQDRRRHRPGRRPHFDRVAYRQRNVIERAVGWLKERRRIATRYEKLAIQYLAMLSVSLIEKYLSVLFAKRA